MLRNDYISSPLVILALGGLAGAGIFMLIGTGCIPGAWTVPTWCAQVEPRYFDLLADSALIGVLMAPAVVPAKRAIFGE